MIPLNKQAKVVDRFIEVVVRIPSRVLAGAAPLRLLAVADCVAARF